MWELPAYASLPTVPGGRKKGSTPRPRLGSAGRENATAAAGGGLSLLRHYPWIALTVVPAAWPRSQRRVSDPVARHRAVQRGTAVFGADLGRHPTAEAHTFPGWTYSFQGKLDAAISECKEAIAVDPDFGNPYNDIGSYLIKLGRLDEAIPWLATALKAPRYEPRHYPHCNLGQVYWAKGMLGKALEEFEQALQIEPEYPFAQAAAEAIRKQIN